MRTNNYFGPEWEQWESRVMIDGKEIQGVGWSTEHGWTPLPGSVIGKETFPSATLEPLADAEVQEIAPNPWRPDRNFPPKLGADVTIDARPAGGTQGWIRLFTGIVDLVAGDSIDEIRVDCIARVDSFRNMVTLPPLLGKMPKSWYAGQNGDESGATPSMLLSQLHHSFYVNAAFEAAGYYSMIPPNANATLRVPNIGSRMPVGNLGTGQEYGTLVHCRRWTGRGSGEPGTDTWGGWGNMVNDSPDAQTPAGWPGVGALGGDFIAHYRPWFWMGTSQNAFFLRLQDLQTESTGPLSDPLEFLFDLEEGGGEWARLRHQDTGELELVSQTSDGTRLTRTIPADKVGKFVLIEFRREGWIGPRMTTSKNGVRTSVQMGQDGWTYQWKSHIYRIDARCPRNRRCGGFMVLDNMDNLPSLEWEPNASIEYDETWQSGDIDASPAMMGRPAREILDEIVEAEMGHWGIRENGHAIYSSTLKRYLADTRSGISASFSESSILGKAEWVIDARAQVSNLIYRAKYPYISSESKINRVLRQYPPTVFKGNAEYIKRGETFEQFVHTPENEDWIYLDYTPYADETPWSTGQPPGLDQSMFGAMAPAKSGEAEGPFEWYPQYSFYGIPHYEQLDYRSWIFHHKAQGSVDITLKSNANPVLHQSRQRAGMPVLVAKSRVQWREHAIDARTRTDLGVPLPDHGAVIEVEGKHWGWSRRGFFVRRLVDALHREQYLLKEMEVPADLRIESGDAILVDFSRSLGIEVRGFVRGLSYRHDSEGGLSMFIDIAVVLIEIVSEIYYTLEDHWSREAVNHYRELEARKANYAAFESDPI